METSEALPLIEPSHFFQADLRVGTVVSAEVLAGAKKPAYKLSIDFGILGLKQSSAQLTQLYQPKDLIGRQVIAVVNFPEKRIAGFKSQCLVLAVLDTGGTVLLSTERPVANGTRIS